MLYLCEHANFVRVDLRIATRNGHDGLANSDSPHKLVKHTSLSAMTMNKSLTRKPPLPVLAGFTTLLLLLFLALPSHANELPTWDGADTATKDVDTEEFDVSLSRALENNHRTILVLRDLVNDRALMPIAIVLHGEIGYLSLIDDRKLLPLRFQDPSKFVVQREVIQTQKRLMNRPH